MDDKGLLVKTEATLLVELVRLRRHGGTVILTHPIYSTVRKKREVPYGTYIEHSEFGTIPL